jgi:hypothetical protein
MRWFVLHACLLLSACSVSTAQTWWSTGRLVNKPHLHMGVRPQMSCGPTSCDGVGVTLQVSTDLVSALPDNSDFGLISQRSYDLNIKIPGSAIRS